MPKNENKNGKNLIKALKTLDYSPIGRHIKNFACIGKSFSVGAPINPVAVNNASDNLGDLDGYLALSTYTDNSTIIPLSGKLYYTYVNGSDPYTSIDVTNLDLTNMIGFVFDLASTTPEALEAFRDGLAALISGNNNNNSSYPPYYPVVNLTSGPLVLVNAQYVGTTENVACFVSPNYRVYFICSETIMYLSQDPETMISNYQQAQKAEQQNNNNNNNAKK